MNVIVCIKQVPSGSVCLDDRGILERSQSGGRLNPGDSYALEAAMQIAETAGGQVTALTMGPESGAQILRTAFSVGVSHGVLVCDRAFAGADVYATAYTLSQAIRQLPPFDVIVCGQQTADGGTAQLPFSLAAQLGIPAVGWIKALEIREGQLILKQELSGGTQQAEPGTPCLLSVGAGIGSPRLPSLRGQLKAKNAPIQVMSLKDLRDQDPLHYGLAGSCTRVTALQQLKREKKNAPIPLSGEGGAEKILSLCREVKAYG